MSSNNSARVTVDAVESAVYYWDFDIGQQSACPICHQSLQGGCISCSASGSNECTIETGACSHVFHRCCITRWVKEREACPLCNRRWAAVQ